MLHRLPAFRAFGLCLPLLAGLALVLSLGASTAQATSPNVVISQVYGGGGNSGATYTHDFVELFNRGTTTVSVAGWSVQYTSATGTGNFGSSSTQITPLSGSLAPGQYLLVQEAPGSGGSTPLPTADVTDATPINMSGTGGKVALVNTTTPLGCNGSSTPCSPAALATIVDLVGWDGANFYEGSAAAPPTTNSTAVLRAVNGCTDTDQNGADFSAGAPTPRNSASPLNPCPTDLAPEVDSTNPADGATGVAVNANLQVTFSEAVNVSAASFDLTCSASGTHALNISGGATTFTLDPATDFANGDSCALTIFAAQVFDQDANDPPDTMSADVVVNFSSGNVCAAAYTPIFDIQGSGANAAITGTVTTRGVVVGDYEGPSPTLRGFYLQDENGDVDDATSDGIFVFNNNNDTVNLGDVVRVTGNAAEFQGQTQITASTILNCGTGSVAPVDVTFPVPSPDYLERYEGMLVHLPQTLYVTEHFQLGRFDQVVLSANGRLQQPTNVTTPSAAANALQAQNDLSKIILDDALQNQNPDPILFARNGQPLSASNTLRGGDTVTDIVGVMTYTWAGNAASGNAYRVRPINALGDGIPNFQAANPRPSAPPNIGGSVSVVGMNLLNFFNTFDGLPDTVDNCTNGVGGPATDCRGADTQSEFDRQYPKTVAAILQMNPDVLAVNEIENDGYDASSAIQFLTDRLNEATAPGTYAFIDVDAATGQVNALGTDAIKVGMLYKPASVTPVGQTAALNSVAFVNGGDSAPRSRPSLAQAFQTNDGAVFIVDANHLKSKGSACDIPDAGDGQGNCNVVRTNAANELVNWLASDPTGTGDADVLIVGDLNSYAQEDPVTALKNAGYTNLVEHFIGADAYSYVFDGQWGYLDHALGSSSLLAQVAGVGEYHINADEPSVLDYNTDFKTANLQNTLYSPDEFRVSDHDPVIVGLDLVNSAPTVDAGGPYNVVMGQTVQVSATGSDPDGDAVTFEWDLDNNGSFETPGQTATFDSTGYPVPSTQTIRVRASDPFGHSAIDETTVSIRFAFTGFFAPVDNRPVFNVVKAGSNVPIKFSLGGDYGMNIFLEGYPKSEPIACDANADTDGIEETDTPGKSELQYNAGNQQYHYNWKTKKNWAGTCRQFVIKFSDGSTRRANFKFK